MEKTLDNNEAGNSAQENSAIRRIAVKYMRTFQPFKDKDNKL